MRNVDVSDFPMQPGAEIVADLSRSRHPWIGTEKGSIVSACGWDLQNG
jgi:hypothetical protein